MNRVITRLRSWLGSEPRPSGSGSPRLPFLKSLRFQLAAWYLAFFSLLFVLSALFLYSLVSDDLRKRLDETLSTQTGTASNLFEDELGEMHGDVPAAASEAVASMRVHGSTVAIFSGRDLLASSEPIPPHSLDDAVSQASASSAIEIIVALPRFGQAGARVAVRRFRTGFYIAALEPLDTIAANLGVIRRALLFGLPVILALAGLGGLWLTTRRLAPLSSMAAQARLITGSNLHTRLAIGDAAEELATLSSSFNELLSRLDQSFTTMRRFVADASHELRTPISVIRGEADVALSHDRSAAEYREILSVILDESRRLSRLVDDLLNLARADAGHVRLQTQDFYLNDLLSDCCRSVQSLANARQIHLECRPATDVLFHGDEELLRRLLVNLLDNAIRYTPPEGRVSADLQAEGNQLQIRIADTGIGIPPEAMPHVFDRFYRADKARSRADGGFGLGLAIVKWIAESHHGVVDVASARDAGSVFTVTLPREFISG